MTGSLILGVVPARYASERFPAKVLAKVGGVPMVVAVARRALKAKALGDVVVATDHAEVAEVCEKHGLKVVMTSPRHPSGTDRLAEVARKMSQAKFLVNIQGDEPLMEPRLINQVAKLVQEHPGEVATAACPLVDEAHWLNPNVVKVLLRRDGRALYFSRRPIPFPRKPGATELAMQHIGIYAYEREMLLWFARQKPDALEVVEGLEQLRLMRLGKDLRVIKTSYRPFGVDTPEDLEHVNQRLKSKR